MSAGESSTQPVSPLKGLEESVKGLKDELQCSLCLDFYMNPVVLPCQHSFCRECVQGLGGPEAQSGSRMELECPLCRKKVLLDGAGLVDCLPRNFHLGEIVGKFRAVEMCVDVIRTGQPAKQQLQKQTSEPEQQQPNAVYQQQLPEEPTQHNGQTQSQQGRPLAQLQEHLEQLQLRQNQASEENTPIRPANCAQPPNRSEPQGLQQRRAALGQHGGLVQQTLQEHLRDSFRQHRKEQPNQQQVLHQPLGKRSKDLEGNLQKQYQQLQQQRQQQQNQQQVVQQPLEQQRKDQKRNVQQLQQQLHQQRQQQQNQQQMLRQQLEQQREGQKRNMQELHQQLRQQRQQQRQQQQNQQQMLRQQLGQQREGQKRNMQQLHQQLRQQRQQHQNQQQMFQKNMQRQQHQMQMQLQQQQQQLQQRLNQQQIRQQQHGQHRMQQEHGHYI